MDRLAMAAVPASLEAGAMVCREGDQCGALALLISGAARVFKLAESGREITLYRIEPGECCILTASCILSARRFPAHAVVERELDAVLVPAAQVRHWMAESATWRNFLWNLLAERLAEVIGLVEEVAFRRMDRRLAAHLANQVSADATLHATHQQIAAELGTSREVVSRILKDFEQRGWLQLARGSILLNDRPALLRLSEACD